MPLSVFTGTMSSLKLFLSFAFLALPSTARTSPRDSLETIRKDVLVIGGGSAGTFGAIRLHDAGKSVAVVEMSGKLGGHADTFYSDTGGVVNVGVQILYVRLVPILMHIIFLCLLTSSFRIYPS